MYNKQIEITTIKIKNYLHKMFCYELNANKYFLLKWCY